MAITEQNRHQRFSRLEEVLGTDEAATLMEHLPPVGWADVATKRDLDNLAVATKRDLDNLAVATKRDLEALGDAMGHRFDAMEARFEATIERSMREQANRYLTWTAALVTVLVATQSVIQAAF